MFTNAIFDVREVARETNLANRVIPVDHQWESATSERQSTVGRRSFVPRDPITGQAYIKCDPTCTYEPCQSIRQRIQALGMSLDRLYCTGCLECTLSAE